MTLAQVQAAMGSLGLTHPPTDWIPITLDDSTDLAFVARALMNRSLTTDVTVAVYTVDAPSTSRSIAIPAGRYVVGLFTRVLSTGTTGGATLSGAK